MSTFIEDLSEKTALVDNDLGVIADSAASNQNKKVKLSSLWTWIKSKCTGHGSGVNADKVDNIEGENIEQKQTLNTLRGNLGTPTVAEMALFQSQFNNKLRFQRPSLIEESSDSGVSWSISTTILPSLDGIGDLMAGDGVTSGGFGIPRDKQIRLTFGSLNYVYLNYLYLYWNTAIHSCRIKIEKMTSADNVWSQVCLTSNAGGWTAHISIPHSVIHFAPTGHNSKVRITFIPTWSTDSASQYYNTPIYVYAIEWCGGYPSGRRNIFAVDRDKNSSFPAKLSASQLGSTAPQGTAPITVVSNTKVQNLNSEFWEGNKFADFLNQALRTTDQPTFQQLTLSYPADSDYEAVRADKAITISTYSDNNAILVNGTTERVRKLSQSVAFILSLVQSDLVLGANTNGCNINNGSSVLLGDTNVSIDLPQRIDQGSDFSVRSLNIGDNDNNELYGAVANGKEAFARNIGEQAMCSGNAPLDTVFSGGVKANTNNVHMECVLQLPNDDFNTAELIPAMTGTLSPTVTTLNYIDFNYGFSERLKHIGYELNIVLDFLNGTGLYDSCTLNFNGMIVIDDLSAVSHTYKQNDSFSHNYAGNDLITESIFRNVELQLDFGTTPANFRIYPKLKINSIETTSNDWFSNVHTTQNVIGDGGGYIISSWKWEFNSIQSAEKIVFISKKK